MILMVKDRATEYIIDSLEFVKVEYLYYLTKDGKVYYRDMPDGALFQNTSKDSVSVFMSRNPTTKYQKEIYYEDKLKKEIEVCQAIAVKTLQNDKWITYVIHPNLSAYLCNNEGKTIRVIN